LNTDERGMLLGAFSGADRIITFTQSGQYRLTSFDLSTHFDEDMIRTEKYHPDTVYTAVYQENDSKHHYIKRFRAELTEKKVEFVENPDRLILFSADQYPRLALFYDMKLKTKGVEHEEITAHEFIGVKGYKAKGKRLTVHAVKNIVWLDPLQINDPAISNSSFQEIGEPVFTDANLPKGEEPLLTDVIRQHGTEPTLTDASRPKDEEPELANIIHLKTIEIQEPDPYIPVEEVKASVSVRGDKRIARDKQNKVVPNLKAGLKFRVDSIVEAEKVVEEETFVKEDFLPPMILLEEPVSLSDPTGKDGAPKKRERKKKQEPSQEAPKGDIEPGDTIQMELPL
jgi:hypothetical protein